MTARDAAPEIDRLVFAVGRRANAIDQERAATLLDSVGLDAPGLYPGLADLILASALTDDVAALRFRYLPALDVATLLGDARDAGRLRLSTGVYQPSAPTLVMLEFFEARKRTAARELWGGFSDEVAQLTGFCNEVIGAVQAGPLLGCFTEVPLPDHAEAKLFKLLERMRYLRSDAHATAWGEAGLTAADMVELTPIWNGQEPKGVASVLASLEARGLIEDGALTDQGRSIRDGIEAETNRLAQPAFDALGDRGADFVELLRALPEEPA